MLWLVIASIVMVQPAPREPSRPDPINDICFKELGLERPKTPEAFIRIYGSRAMRRCVIRHSDAKWPESLLLPERKE